MKINLSPAEWGAVVYAIQSVYQEDSEEGYIAQQICDAVYKHLGPEFYDCWVHEFDLDSF